MKQSPKNRKKAKISTIWLHGGYRYLPKNKLRRFGVVIKFGGYSGEIAQIDDGIEEKLIFRICPKSTISLLVSRYDMSNMRCFPIGGMKRQLDAILESFGTTEGIIYSLTRLPSITYSLLPFSLLDFKNLELASSPCSSQSSKLFSVNFLLSRKIARIGIFLSQILT